MQIPEQTNWYHPRFVFCAHHYLECKFSARTFKNFHLYFKIHQYLNIGLYFDGHNKEDVVIDRNGRFLPIYLELMEKSYLWFSLKKSECTDLKTAGVLKDSDFQPKFCEEIDVAGTLRLQWSVDYFGAVVSNIPA